MMLGSGVRDRLSFSDGGSVHFSFKKNIKEEENLDDDFWVSYTWQEIISYTPILDAEEFVGEMFSDLVDDLAESISE
jgi:hypothetical protein